MESDVSVIRSADNAAASHTQTGPDLTAVLLALQSHVNCATSCKLVVPLLLQ